MKTPTPKTQCLSSTQWAFIFQSKEKPKRRGISPLTVRVFTRYPFHFSTALFKDRGEKNELPSLIISEKSPEPVDITCHGVNGSHGRCTIRAWAFRRRHWRPIPVLLPGKSNGRRSLVACSPWGRQELDTTERLHFHFSLSCIGDGNGNPLQCSCLENPRDGEAWWAADYGVAQSRTRLKRLSSSSSSS